MRQPPAYRIAPASISAQISGGDAVQVPQKPPVRLHTARTAQELRIFMSQDPLPRECSPGPLSKGERVGLICTVVCRMVSLSVVVAVMGRILLRGIYNHYRPTPEVRRIFRTPIDVYMSSLLLAHVVQASTGTFSISWLRRGSASCGLQCDAQGLIETIGDPAVAMSTLAIAVHIFLCVFFGWRPPTRLRVPIGIVSLVWTYFLVHAGVSKAIHRSVSRPLITPTPYWCWISGWYQRERLTAAYMWYWTTAAACTVIYVVLFLYIRGNVELARDRRFSISLHKAPRPISRTGTRFSLTAHSRKMLIYPAAYIAVILPQSLIRWMTASGITVQPFWVFSSQCIFSLGGLCDALLLIFTRPHVLGFETGPAERRRSVGISMVASTRCEWNDGLQSTNSETVLTTAAAMEPDRELQIHTSREIPIQA